jgi:hypothetical protein
MPRGFVDPLAGLARVLYLLSLGVMHVYLPLFDDMLMDSDFYYRVFVFSRKKRVRLLRKIWSKHSS